MTGVKFDATASEEKVIQDILEKYPQAVKATLESVRVGDALCNHVSLPCMVVTQKMHDSIIEKQSELGVFYIVANVSLPDMQ